MGQEADYAGDYDYLITGEDGVDDDDDVRVLEWEIGLPGAEDLTPLWQALIPFELASAFSIAPEPSRTLLDVHEASHQTVSSLCGQISSSSSSSNSSAPPSKPFPSFAAPPVDDVTMKDGTADSSSSRKMMRKSEMEHADPNDDSSAPMLKRPRLVWTPQLHKRFVDVVTLLGINKAVPKTIMQLMNVEGLTRENVASHLQKYRLYLKTKQGPSDECPSTSDHFFGASPMPAPAPMLPYAPAPGLIPMPVLGLTHYGPGAPMAMVSVNGQHGVGVYHGSESHHPYGAFGERQGEWSGGNKLFPMVPYPHV